MPINLNEPIWKEEITRWADDALAMWKTQYFMWQRAQHQGAPPALVNELATLCEQFKAAYERIKALLVYFPEEGE